MTDTTAIEQRQDQAPAGLISQIHDVMPQLERLGINADRFARTLISETRKNPRLLECTPASFLGAAFAAAQLGLEPGPLEQVWMIPRRNRRRGIVEVQFMIGYRGMVELARRVGVIVTANTVHANDYFAERQGSDPLLEHTPNHAGPGDPILWYAVARFPDGRTIHRVLNKAEVERRRKMSSTPYEAGKPWFDHYDAMARKTAIRALWSEMPADPMLQEAQRQDEQVLHLPSAGAARPAIASGRDASETSGSSTSSEAPEQEPVEPEAPKDTRSIGELRKACDDAGLPKNGSRQDLLDRLAQHAAGQDDDAVEGEVVHEGGPPMPPPPEDPDDVPVDAEDADADDDQDDDGPTAAQWRERMVRALQGITSQHPRYVPIWARMVDLVGDPTGVPLPTQVEAWADADAGEVEALVTEVEQLAVAWKAENR